MRSRSVAVQVFPEHVPATLATRTTRVAGVLLGEPTVRPDVRGWFVRIFDEQEWPPPTGCGAGRWVQENQLRSRYGTIRGMHFRADLQEAKMVRVVAGEAFDVVVDVRPWSSTFLQWDAFILDEHRHEQLFVPPGCAHGFQALTDRVDICVKTSTYYDPSLDRGFSWQDEQIGIRWPIPDAIVSDRDRTAPTFADVRPQLASWFGASEPRPT